MAATEHGRPAFDEVRALLVARAAALGLEGEEAEVLERLLAAEVPGLAPTEAECRRHYAAEPGRFGIGALVEASHILFALTPRVPPGPLRGRAAQVHAEASRDPARFAELAREYSNCPSGAEGGRLGQVARGETVPEFEQALFAGKATGVLPELVSTRFGFHVVHVVRRIAGRIPAFEEARAAVEAELHARAEERALAEYVRGLQAAARRH